MACMGEETGLRLLVLKFPPCLGILLTPSFLSWVCVCSTESPKCRDSPSPVIWAFPDTTGVRRAGLRPLWPVCPVLSPASWSHGDAECPGHRWALSQAQPFRRDSNYPSLPWLRRMGH